MTLNPKRLNSPRLEGHQSYRLDKIPRQRFQWDEKVHGDLLWSNTRSLWENDPNQSTFVSGLNKFESKDSHDSLPSLESLTINNPSASRDTPSWPRSIVSENFQRGIIGSSGRLQPTTSTFPFRHNQHWGDVLPDFSDTRAENTHLSGPNIASRLAPLNRSWNADDDSNHVSKEATSQHGALASRQTRGLRPLNINTPVEDFRPRESCVTKDKTPGIDVNTQWNSGAHFAHLNPGCITNTARDASDIYSYQLYEDRRQPKCNANYSTLDIGQPSGPWLRVADRNSATPPTVSKPALPHQRHHKHQMPINLHTLGGSVEDTRNSAYPDLAKLRRSGTPSQLYQGSATIPPGYAEGRSLTQDPRWASSRLSIHDANNEANHHTMHMFQCRPYMDLQQHYDTRSYSGSSYGSSIEAGYTKHAHRQNWGISISPPQSTQSIGIPPVRPPQRMAKPGPSIPVGSQLLLEFRTNNRGLRRYELQDIYNHAVEFSGDQNGSRFIQDKLMTANSEEKQRIFHEILPNALPLMTDVFGNYVVQRFFERGDQSQKSLLVAKMKGQMMMLSNHVYGCRVVQSALQFVLVEQQISLVKELEADNNVMKCLKDQNGNHVVQAIIEHVPPEHIPFVINMFIGQVRQLATNVYGCRVIQRILKYWSEPGKSAILNEVHACAGELISDQFGNYVVQHILEFERAEDRQRMVNVVRGDLVNLSKQKFASNVVEKCIACGSEELRRGMMLQLAIRDERGQTPLTMMIKDAFANYVIQKLLDSLDESNYTTFVEILTPEIARVKRLGPNKQAENVAKKMHRFDHSFACSEGSLAEQGYLASDFIPHMPVSAPFLTPPATTDGARTPSTGEEPPWMASHNNLKDGTRGFKPYPFGYAALV